MEHQQEDTQFDERLREHLAAELNGQLGRAARAFDRHLASARRPRARGRRKHWVIAGVIGTALAASLAGLWAVPVGSPKAPRHIVSATTVPAPLPVPHTPARWEEVEQVTSSITLDKGLVVIDEHTPARLIRRVATERTQWIDPQRGVRVEAIVPREDVSLISLDTY